MANGTGSGSAPPTSVPTITIAGYHIPAVPFATIQNILALIVTLAFVALIFTWMFYPPKIDSNAFTLLNILLGFFGAAFGNVMSFYFGSSKSSQDKDARTAASADAGSAAAATAAKDDSEAAWAILRTSRDPEALRKFVSDYPGSQHKAEAEAIIAGLNNEAKP